ncbi:hypothetical protein PAMA_011636 [Pampus argenteus]
MSDKSLHSSLYNELRLAGEFCDAVIRVEGVEFEIHKLILCNCSPYFRALFRRWSTPDKKVFDIPGLSPYMMQLIIEFAYTGFVPVMEENVQELLLAADQLDVMEIVQTCCNFLEEQLCPKNCIGIWWFTKTFCSFELQRKAYRYIIEHFEDVISSKEFLQLTVQDLADIIEKDDLRVKNETTVYEAVLYWIAHAPKDRGGHIAMLLSKVRLAMMDIDPECLPIIDATQNMCNPLTRPRMPTAIVLAIGGWRGGDPTNCIEAYDIRADFWINLTNNQESPCAYHGAVVLNGSVYCVGGFDRVEHFNSVRRFDLITHTWHEVAPMYFNRCYVSVTVLNGCIYAMGGYDGHVRLNSAERYRPETNQWSVIAPMHEHRSDASCTVLHDKVYICGGFNGNECLQTAEYYSPETNQWTMITPMNIRRSGIGVIAYADHVYAVGGFDGNSRLSSVEAYSPRTNTWHAVSSMLTPRSNFGIEVVDDRILVVGGYDGLSVTNNVEYYETTTNAWSEACDMAVSRSALSCCVVSGLPNMADYTFSRDDLLFFNLEEASNIN